MRRRLPEARFAELSNSLTPDELSSTDPAARFMVLADVFREDVDRLDVETAGPMFGDDEFDRLLKLHLALGDKLHAINRLNGHFATEETS